ncbi:MAG: Flp family type IVb pilin [Thermodesulfobacteriota bacterium]|nr:Flp family type IVb pilin [Thermodesulfobacteriota bacterium]
MKDWLKALRQDESGATAIEYGLIVGLCRISRVLATFSDKLSGLFNAISGKIEEATDNINNPPPPNP